MSMHKKITFCKNPKDGHPFSNTLLCLKRKEKCKATTTDMKNLNRKIRNNIESSGVKKIMPPNS